MRPWNGNTQWMEQAACTKANPDLFFPEPSPPKAHVEAAKAVCRACPVQSQCLEFALVNHENVGIWGGKTERERRRIARERRRARILNASFEW